MTRPVHGKPVRFGSPPPERKKWRQTAAGTKRPAVIARRVTSTRGQVWGPGILAEDGR